MPCCGETSTSSYQPWRSLYVFQQSHHEPTVTPVTIPHSFPTVERIAHSEGKPKSSRWLARPYVTSSQYFHFSRLNSSHALWAPATLWLPCSFSNTPGHGAPGTLHWLCPRLTMLMADSLTSSGTFPHHPTLPSPYSAFPFPVGPSPSGILEILFIV